MMAIAPDENARGAETPLLTLPMRTAGTLVMWLLLVLLYASGESTRAAPNELGLFATVAVLSLTVSFGLVLLLRNSYRLIPFVTAGSYTILTTLPLYALDALRVERTVLLDMFLVLLLALPSLLRIWPWWAQSGATVIAVLVTWTLRAELPQTGVVHSVLLVFITGALSSFALLLRERVDPSPESAPRGSEKVLRVAAGKELPLIARQILLLDACAVIGLILLDFWSGLDESSMPVLVKAYSLVVVVCGSLLVSVSRKEHLPRTVLVANVILGLTLSIAHTGYGENALFPHALVMTLLMWTTVFFPWPLLYQLHYIWLVLLGDLAVKIAIVGSGLAFTPEHMGEVFIRYRTEIVPMAFGAFSTVLATVLLRQSRLRYINRLSSVLFGQGKTRGAVERDTDVGAREFPVQPIARLLPFGERSQRLLVGLFGLGIISNILLSALTMKLLPDYWAASMVGWVSFLLAWGFTLYQERQRPPNPHLWTTGALVGLLMFATPLVVVLLVGKDPALWAIWPTLVLILIGAIPWPLKELLPMMFVVGVLGIEVAVALRLGAVESSVCIVVFVLSALIAITSSRRLRTRALIERFLETLGAAQNEFDAARQLTEALRGLFVGHIALFSANEEHLEVIKEETSYVVPPEQWPLRAVNAELGASPETSDGVAIRAVQFLPASFDFLDTRFGVCSISRGAILEVVSRSESRDDKTRVHGLVVLIGTRGPLSPLLQSAEWSTARVLAIATRMRCVAFQKEQARRRAISEGALELQQREYELSSLVHEVNNTMQDLTLLCDSIVEDDEGEPSVPPMAMKDKVVRIGNIARSVATFVSDAKRRRELEKLEDLSPRELVEVTEVMRELAGFAALRAERKRITVSPPVLPDHPVWVRVSVREHLETILRNLLQNAINYTSPGTVVRMLLEVDASMVTIKVVDNGAGLTAEECTAVFEPGFRGRASIGSSGGLGLGLAESKRVAESAGGTVTVVSDGPGKGSTFIVALPRARPPEVQGSGQSWALLVDDQSTLTDFYSRIARAIGLRAEVAHSVNEATQLVEQHGRPTLVITDIHLGESDGLDLVKEVRVRFGSSVPVLVISGLNGDEISERVRASGATDFVQKPVGQRVLFARVQSLLAT